MNTLLITCITQGSGEAAELSADRAFANSFSDAEMKKGEQRMLSRIRKRGWKNLMKDGIKIDSFDAIISDRIAVADYDAFELVKNICGLVRDATPAELRALRLTFKAGSVVGQALQIRNAAAGSGAPKKLPDILRSISKANDQWRRQNPKATRGPTAPQLRKLYTGPDYGGARNFANHVSKWRKTSENRYL